MQQEQAIKEVDITIAKPHMLMRLVRPNNGFVAASRGAQKTTRIAPFYLNDCIKEMPGTLGCLVGPDYEHLEKNTLNPLFNALQELGYEDGVHYTARVRPPDDWDKPLVKVVTKNYDKIYTFLNGTQLMEISMMKAGTANGQSFQFGLFDETKLYNEEQLKSSVYKAFRGTPLVTKLYGKNSLFLSKLHLTDKYASPDKVNWILDKKKLNDYNKINVIIQLELHLQLLNAQYDRAGINQRKRLQLYINAVEVRLHNLRKDLTFYVEANHEDVIKVLGKEDGEIWLNNQKMNSKPYEFSVAIENKDPDRPEDGFYPDFDRQKHVHSLYDYEATLPIILGADYQHSVAPIKLAQISKLPDADRLSLNYFDEVYTLAPQGLDEAVEAFCERYKNHIRRTIFYVFDQTATGKRMNAKKYKETVIDILRKHKWNVVEVYIGQQPQHYDKYKDTKTWLKEEDPKALPIRINSKCQKSIKSIEGAAAITDTRGETKKNKTYENTTKYPHLDQSETTHYSDVFDMINDAVLKKGKIPLNYGTGGDTFGIR